MFFNLLQLILNCKKAYSILTLSYIEEKVGEVYVNNLLPLKETIANPIFGFIADKAGMNHNIRFFSPYIDAKYDNDGKRNFKEDTSSDPISALYIKFFPSSSRQFALSTTHSENPLNVFNINKKDSVKFYANLFIAILQEKKDFNFNFTKAASEKDKKHFDKRIEIFGKIKDLFFREDVNSIFKDKTIKLLFIHSYIINALDQSNKDDLEEYFQLYISEIAKSYLSFQDPKFFEIKVEKEILKKSVDYYKIIDSSFFPYSAFNKPETNRIIPSFIRKGNGAFSKKSNEHFSDCVDVAILHLCNCLFYKKGLPATGTVPNPDFSLKHLPNSSYDLKEFYRNHPNPFTLTLEIRNDWSKVVQDLNDEKFPDTDSKYPTDYISYNKPTNNEIFPGIINMMNVLIRITGLNAKDIFPSEFNEKSLVESLKKLIGILSIKEEGNSVAKIEIEPGAIKEYKTNKKDKKDFSGTFEIVFNYLNKTQETIKVSHTDFHADVDLICKDKTYCLVFKEERLKNMLRHHSYHNLMFKSFLFPEDEDFEWRNGNNWNEFYLSSRIDNNSSSLKILNRICRFIDSVKKPEITKTWEKIMIQILDKVELSDRGTRNLFKQFLFLKKSTLKNNAELAILAYEETKSFSCCSAYLKTTWQKIFESEVPECTKLDLTFILSRYKLDSIIGLICNFTNITELKIAGLRENKLEKIFENLKYPKLVEKLDLRLNKKLIIPEEIRKFTELKSINLSYCGMNLIPTEIFHLDSLEELNFSFNSIIKSLPEFYESLKSFKKLKTLDLANNYISEDSLEMLFELKTLEELNLSKNAIFELPSNIKNLSNLKVLNLKGNYIRDLPIEISYIESLTEIFVDLDKISAETKSVFGNRLCD